MEVTGTTEKTAQLAFNGADGGDGDDDAIAAERAAREEHASNFNSAMRSTEALLQGSMHSHKKELFASLEELDGEHGNHEREDGADGKDGDDGADGEDGDGISRAWATQMAGIH